MERTETQVTPRVSPPVTLHVTEYGDRDSATHVVLVHGFPDDQRMWEPVVAALPADWHVITYDVRGAGAPPARAGRSSYRTELLVEDLIAVLDATVPAGERVHLVGHDWGSIACGTRSPPRRGTPGSRAGWRRTPRPAGRRSTTWAPPRPLARDGCGCCPRRCTAGTSGCSCCPGCPSALAARAVARAPDDARCLDPTIDLLPWGREVRENTSHTIDLYRANVLARLRDPLPWRTSMPVLLVVATPRRLRGARGLRPASRPAAAT